MTREERAAWAALVRNLRTDAKLDQQTLAELAGTTRRTIGSIERGDVVPQADGLKRILGVLGVEVDPEPAEDVRQFLNLITPLLERLSPQTRAVLQPRIVEMVTDAFAPDLSLSIAEAEVDFDAPSDLPPAQSEPDDPPAEGHDR